MVFTITARHIDLTDAIRNYIQKRLEKLSKYEPRITEIHITITVEKKYRHIVEINLHSRRFDVVIKEESEDMYAAIDGAVDRISKILRRHKDKVRSKRHKEKTEGFEPDEE
ncbi:MAG: ribosome-associated translation inhibitor RaiA [Candidatus Omnitrophica bacterium]|nr:ribosome-associated translation inhibitor RaiA [Candidatus Omnitrophota bacterium]